MVVFIIYCQVCCDPILEPFFLPPISFPATCLASPRIDLKSRRRSCVVPFRAIAMPRVVNTHPITPCSSSAYLFLLTRSLNLQSNTPTSEAAAVPPSTSPGAPVSSTPACAIGPSSVMRDLAGSDNGLVYSDRPIPSTEDNTGGLSNPNHYMSGALHSRNPSLSYTPPLTTIPASQATTPPSHGATPRGSIANIDHTLGNMRLSDPRPSLGMSDVAAMLNSVTDNPRDRSTLSPIPTPPDAGRPASRRRSSSRMKGTSPHDVTDEELPRDRFHEPGFQQAFTEAKRAMVNLTDILGSSPLHTEPDSMMRHLHWGAETLSRFQCPSTRTVGFVGDSGVGKCYVPIVYLWRFC